MGHPTVHRGFWTRDLRAGKHWPQLPFDVPAGCRSIAVELAFDPASGAVVDLGCAGVNGWRGWSGGARRSYVITPDAATPGYVPGELEPGEWHVVLGLHRLPAAGVEVTVTITTDGDAVPEPPRPRPPVPAKPRPRGLPAAAGLRWVAVDLHAHTVHSDGELTVAELAAAAVAAGLDALAVTDHNTVSHHAELAAVAQHYGIALIPGQEITTEYGHANAFGDIGWIDFREPAANWVKAVHERGGLLSINHPLSGDCAWRHPLPEHPPLAEVWHSSWQVPTWGGPVAWWQAWGSEATPIGGSDWHRDDEGVTLGSPTTWVAVDAHARNADELVPAVLDGLRAGRTAVSATRTGPVLLPVDGRVIALDAAGALVVGQDKTHKVRFDRETFDPPGPHGHVLCGHDGSVLALAGTPH
jgi:PHP domain-containing protein